MQNFSGIIHHHIKNQNIKQQQGVSSRYILAPEQAESVRKLKGIRNIYEWTVGTLRE